MIPALVRRSAPLAAALLLAAALPAQAADRVPHLPFKQAVDAGLASGKLDGSVKFHLAGSGPKGTVLRAGIVSNKKTNGVGKSDENACLWAAQSALISLQEAAKKQGANAVTNIVSFFRKNEYRNATNFECHAGNIMVGVALKGDLVKTR